LNKIVSGLISDVSVLLQEKSVLGDLVGNVIGRIFLVDNAVRKV